MKLNSRLSTVLVAGAALAALSGSAIARDNVSFSISFGIPGPVYAVPAPAYYPPAPAYYAPAPAYYPPGPFYYAPRRVVVVPPPAQVVYVPRFGQLPAVGYPHRHWRHHGHGWGR